MREIVEITLDFETYYSKKEKYSLSAKGMTYEKYIRNPKFEIIGLAVKEFNRPAQWLAPHEIQDWLDYVAGAYGWENVRVIAHNAMFDMAILGWLYNVYPYQVADTMLMSRAIMLWDGNSLDVVTKQLREKYNWGLITHNGVKQGQRLVSKFDFEMSEDKGEEVHNADGKHLMEFTDEEYDAYGKYAMNDVDLTKSAYDWFIKKFKYPEEEIDVMTMTLEMFTYPVMELDKRVLLEVQKDVEFARETLRDKVGLSVEQLRSDAIFADALCSLGVEPPTKLNSKGEVKYAFAKSDLAFLKLLDHDDPNVVDLVQARLGNKSSQAVTRVQTFIDMADRGLLPIPIEYYGARTGRFSGGSGCNVQNLNRNKLVSNATKFGQFVFYKGKADRVVEVRDDGKVHLARAGVVDNSEEDLHEFGLRDSFVAPKGKKLVVQDLAQIEARCLSWLAGEQWVLDAFIAKKDIYKATASQSFGVPYEEVTKAQRFTGKAQVLGLGYQAGVNGLKVVLGKKSEDFDDDTLQSWVTSYRQSVPKIVALWDKAKTALGAMVSGVSVPLDDMGVLSVEGNTIKFPNGMRLVYRHIEKRQDESGFGEFWYWGKNQTTGKPGWEKTFQGRIVENCIAEDTEVLTDRGWVKIQDVKLTDKVHDGVEFVTHKGILFKSVQSCVNIDGVYMTTDHEVLTNDGWKQAGVLLSERSTSSIQRLDRATLREISCFGSSSTQKLQPLAISVRLWQYLSQVSKRRDEVYKERSYAKLRVLHKGTVCSTFGYAPYEQTSTLCDMAFNEATLYATEPQSVAQLRWSGHNSLSAMVRQFRELSRRYVSYLSAWFGFRPYKQRWELRTKELQMGFSKTKYKQSQEVCANNVTRRNESNGIGVQQNVWGKTFDRLVSLIKRGNNATVSGKSGFNKKVYDILDCGERHRFVVRGSGEPFIVHNCIQGIARIVLTDQMLEIRSQFAKRGWGREVAHLCMQVHDEVICCCKEEIAEEVFEIMQHCMAKAPKWATGLPLGSDGDIAQRYGAAK